MSSQDHSLNIPHLDSTYGAMLVGVVFAALFQGLLTVQAFNYFDNFPDDKVRNKVMVLTLIVLDTVHLILICKATYNCLVTNWGVESHLMTSPIELNLHLIFTALSMLVAQAFFLERIWKFSKGNIWLTASLVTFAIVPFGLTIHLTVLLVPDTSVVEYTKHVNEGIALFILGAFSDFTIACTTYYYLKKEKSSFQSTMSVVSRAIQIVVATGFATSMIALASLIAFLAGHDTTFYFIAIHFQLGRTYTNALLATLNSRRNMRQMLAGGSQGFKSTGTYLGDLQLESAAPRSKDIDLTYVGDSTNIVCLVQKQTESDRSMHSGDETGKGHVSDKSDVEAPYAFAK